MTLDALAWLFALSVTVHNLEEAWLLPAWSQSAGRWHRPVRAREFRFAVAVLTAAAYLVVILGVRRGPHTVAAYLLTGYALAMLLNAFFPHLLATILTRRYAPGTATGLLLNVPVTALLLREALGRGQIRGGTFVWAGPLVVATIVASIPVLFALGRWSSRRDAS